MKDNVVASWRFVDDNGAFALKDPHKSNYLYFPLVSERGMVSAVTPMLHGDDTTNLGGGPAYLAGSP